MAGIYLHIPFCKQACHYCDFHFSTNLQLKEKLLNAMVKEAAIRKDYLEGEIVRTIYFGGGTPSLLQPTELQQILEALAKNYPLATELEITLEANPDDLSSEKLLQLKSAGINRLSIGIQSFRDEHLRFMNRAHDARQAHLSVSNAREAGFRNISIDLIYALPSPNHSQWREDLALALLMRPEHISSYCLTIEPQTAFGHWVRKGKMDGIDDDYAALQFEILLETLQGAGYEQYEISNFCLPGMYSRHNRSYWQQQAYLGLGPSAHSFNGMSRQFNVKNNSLYIKAMESNQLGFEKEILSPINKINEYLLTGLRTKWGCSLDFLQNELNYDLKGRQDKLLTDLEKNGLLLIKNRSLVLSDKGKLLADEIVSQLMLSEET